MREDSYQELEHYGIKGMKWGVRRTPEQLGHHKIKKGTKVYTISGKRNNRINGFTRVVYLPPDRANIRGVEARLRNEKKSGGRSREVSYKLTTDLKIPSQKELQRAYEEAMNDPKIRESAFRSIAESYIKSPSANTYYKKKYGSDAKSVQNSDFEKEVSKYLKEYGSYTPGELFDMAAESMTLRNSLGRKAVSEILKSKGYNAMVDETSIDRYGVVSGLEPVIIFDGASSLKEVSSKELSDREISKADKQYKDWRRSANSYTNKLRSNY